MKNKNKWLSPLPPACEVCNQPFGKYFIDGKTSMGPWGLMCEECHENIGCGLGIGRGRKYLTKTREGVDGFDE